MYAVERQTWILERTRKAGRIEVSATCSELDVAPETIRRDLNELERQGLLRRVHGGAVPVERVGFEGELSSRASVHLDEKQRIAEVGLGLIGNAESIYLDDGSTVQVLAEGLFPTRPLTVVTNALPTASLLVGRPNVDVFVLGGRVRERTVASLEHWALRMLDDLVIDLAIVGANGVSRTRGLTCPDPAVASVKAAALQASRRALLLVDHTKLGVESFCRFGDVSAMEAVITDRAASAQQVRDIHEEGVEVMLA